MGVTPGSQADLYAMGALMYRLATGRAPFALPASSEGDIHALAAFVRSVLLDKPRRLIDVNPLVSRFLSDIVDKLLEKSPDDRYCSAYGAWRDLIEAANLHTQCSSPTPSPMAPFQVGRYDVTPHLEFGECRCPVGREAEVRVCRAAFDEAAAGASVLLTLAGSSGAGKSTIVNQIMRFRVGDGGLEDSRCVLLLCRCCTIVVSVVCVFPCVFVQCSAASCVCFGVFLCACACGGCVSACPRCAFSCMSYRCVFCMCKCCLRCALECVRSA